MYDIAIMKPLADIARSYYTDELPYHNFAHIELTLRIAKKLTRRCRQAGVSPNWPVIKASLLFHDAGYHIDSKSLGHTTKEAFSASIADKELKKAGYDAGMRRKVRQYIMATRIFGRARTLEQKIVRLADASAGMDGSFSNFMRSNRALEQEWHKLYGAISHEQWCAQTKLVVSRYIRSDLSVPNIEPRLDAAFNESDRRNLRTFLRDEAAHHEGK